MKKLQQNFYQIFVAVGFVIGCSGVAFAQKMDKSTVQNLIQSKEFVFKAETMLPLGGGAKQLTSNYDVRLLGDSIVSYLPYFGRAYMADLTGQNAMDFTSTKFNYAISNRKRGGWEIDVKPADTRDIRNMHFIVSENGYAQLQVISNNRQAISYNGYILPGKK